MTKLLEQAIEAARQLSSEEQDELARVIMEVVGSGTAQGSYVLSDEEWASMQESLAQADRGEFATQEEIEAVFAKYR